MMDKTQSFEGWHGELSPSDGQIYKQHSRRQFTKEENEAFDKLMKEIAAEVEKLKLE